METEYDAVIHLAALVRVGESEQMPIKYYITNLNGTMNIILMADGFGKAPLGNKGRNETARCYRCTRQSAHAVKPCEQITAEAEAEASAEDAEEESGDQEEGEEENEVKDNLSMFVDMADEYRLKEED